MIWICAALLGVILVILISNNCITVSRYEISTEQAEGRIVHLSDIHSCKFTDRLLEWVKREDPDFIVITGDLWDRTKRDIPRMLDFVEKLCEICKVVYVPGNHEFHEPEHEQIFLQLQKKGAEVLRNRIISPGKIQLLGLDKLKYGAFTEQELQRLEQRAGFRMVAAHYPQDFEKIYAGRKIDLVLCGHAHGGQFRIPFVKKGIYSPGQGLFPKYSEGMHEKDGVKMIVSRGIGNSRFPFRLFNCPEIIVIDLKKA